MSSQRSESTFTGATQAPVPGKCHDNAPRRVANVQQPLGFFSGDEPLTILPHDRLGGHVGKRILGDQLPFLRRAEEHAGELQPLVNRGRGQFLAHKEQFEVFGIGFGHVGQVPILAEMFQ
jgi:hypothetical protein